METKSYRQNKPGTFFHTIPGLAKQLKLEGKMYELQPVKNTWLVKLEFKHRHEHYLYRWRGDGSDEGTTELLKYHHRSFKEVRQYSDNPIYINIAKSAAAFCKQIYDENKQRIKIYLLSS